MCCGLMNNFGATDEISHWSCYATEMNTIDG